MKQSTAISIALHAAVLAWATLSYSGRALEAPKTQAMPVDFISEKDFSQLTKGVKEAPKKKKPKALVEKIGTPKPVHEPKAKVAKKEVKTAHDNTPPPAPKVKPPEKKHEAKAKPKAPPKIDEIGKKIKDQADSKKKKEAALKPDRLPPRRPPRPRPKEKKYEYRPDQIKALLNKRTPQRLAAAGNSLNKDPSLGAVSGQAALLSQSEIDALKRRIESCWNFVPSADSKDHVVVYFRMLMRRDGTVAEGPVVSKVVGSTTPFGPQFAESGRRAILQCQPYTMLSQDSYDQWKDIEIGFDSAALQH